eukprot:g6888.t1
MNRLATRTSLTPALRSQRACEASVDALSRSILGDDKTSGTKTAAAAERMQAETPPNDAPTPIAPASSPRVGRVLSALRGRVSVEYGDRVRIGERVEFGPRNPSAAPSAVGIVTGFSRDAVFVSLLTANILFDVTESSFASTAGRGAAGGETRPNVFTVAEVLGACRPAGLNSSAGEANGRSPAPAARSLLHYSSPPTTAKPEASVGPLDGQDDALDELEHHANIPDPHLLRTSKSILSGAHSRHRRSKAGAGVSFQQHLLSTGNYLLDFAQVLRHGQRVTLTGLPNAGKTFFLATLARNYAKGQSVVVTGMENAHKFPNSVVFAQDWSETNSGEQGWLSLLLAVQYARSLSSKHPGLLILDDVTRFAQEQAQGASPGTARPFMSVKDLVRGALDLEKEDLTVLVAADEESYPTSEDGSDVVLRFENQRPSFKDVRRYAKTLLPPATTRSSSTTLLELKNDVAKELLDRADVGVRWCSTLDDHESCSLHVDEWDRAEAESMAAAEVLLNCFHDESAILPGASRWHSPAADGVAGTDVRPPAGNDAEAERQAATSSAKPEALAESEPESLVEKYRNKVAGRCGGLSSLLGMRSRKKKNQVSQYLNFEKQVGEGSAGAAAGDRQLQLRHDAQSKNSQFYATIRNPPTAFEVTALARACTIYHFTRCPTPVEAAIFRRRFWRVLRREVGAAGGDGLSVGELDEILLRVRYEFDLVRPQF